MAIKRYTPMKKLKLMRVSRELTILELAENAGLNRNTVNQYELGIHAPRKENLKALAQALDCEVRDII